MTKGCVWVGVCAVVGLGLGRWCQKVTTNRRKIAFSSLRPGVEKLKAQTSGIFASGRGGCGAMGVAFAAAPHVLEYA